MKGRAGVLAQLKRQRVNCGCGSYSKPSIRKGERGPGKILWTSMATQTPRATAQLQDGTSKICQNVSHSHLEICILTIIRKRSKTTVSRA